jgi:signal transduction histidine kinase/CheY-like chemotaxis protein/HPt (histidine-containing phosphotransfer) domain-containing protein
LPIFKVYLSYLVAPLKIILVTLISFLFSGLCGQTAGGPEVLLQLAQKHRDANAEKAISYARQAINASGSKSSKAVVNAYLLIGRIMQDKNELPEAYDEYTHALSFAVATRDSQLIGRCYYSIGDVYKTLGMFSESYFYLDKALEIAKAIRDTNEIVAFSDKLGHLHMDHGEDTRKKEFYDQALGYYNYSLGLNKASPNVKRLANSYVNLANAHLVFLRHGADSANAGISIAYSLEGIKIANENKLPDSRAINLLNIGEAYLNVQEYDKALIYFQYAYSLYDSLGRKLWQATCLRDVALAWKGKQHYDKAIENLERANSLAREFGNTEQHENYFLLSELYTEKKEYRKALEALKKFQELQKLSLNTQSTIALERRQMQYEVESRDQEIKYLSGQKKLAEEKLEKDVMINYVLLAVIILVVVIALLLYNRSRLLQKSKEISDKARIMQEQFLANTSHEIRTPMNGIMGMANQLLNSSLTDEQKQQVQLMKKSSDKLLRIINDLLDFSKIKAGKFEFYTRTFDTALFFRELFLMMNPRAADKNIQLGFHIAPAIPPYLTGDEQRLEQILVNLLDNALKFTERGSVSLTVVKKNISRDRCELEFSVNDSGPGIPASQIRNIFENFVQLENAGQRKHGGSGLGLPIVKFLVEEQGGSISVNSEEGKGSEFIFSLPFGVAEHPPETKLPAHKKKDLNFARILVVEDNPINQKVIENTLQGWNAQYTLVGSAVECFDELFSQEYDVLLMDIELPAISGIEAAKYIRSRFTNENRNIPIIALTAYAYETERQKCLDAGMNEVVVKPFSPDELYAKIQHFSGDRAGEKNIVLNQNIESNFSLKELQRKYDGNQTGFIELLQLFKTEIPEYIARLNELASGAQYEEMSRLAHMIKSPFRLAGAADLAELIEELDKKENFADSVLRKELTDKINRGAVVLLADIETYLSSPT